jgi:hypothetical protein
VSAKQSNQLVSDQLISGEVRMPGGATTRTMILQYKYVEWVVHDVKIKYMNSMTKKT